MNTRKFYQVLVNNGVTVEWCAEKNENLLIIVPFSGQILPNVSDSRTFVVLHAMHANNSLAMEYDSGSGSYICCHCGHRANLSKDTRNDILRMLSTEKYGVFPSDISRVTICVVSSTPFLRQ